jgi:heme/copper-type cytochrome/quinol oxidase subunit 1
LYLLTGVAIGAVGFSLSIQIRVPIKRSKRWVPVLWYYTVITVHAIVIVFFTIIAILLSSLGNILIPLFSGKRDIDLPRLNSFSYFTFLIRIIQALRAIITTPGVPLGWTLYAPLSLSHYSTGSAVRRAILSLHIATLASLARSINFIITAWRNRKRGVQDLAPIVWAELCSAFLLVVSLPVLGSALILLLIARRGLVQIFDGTKGSDVIIYENIFWFFAHPEVYVIIIPAFASVTHSCMWVTRKTRAIGYNTILLAMLSIARVGTFVWAHHLYVAGIDTDTQLYFRASTIVIAVPTGIKVFRWRLSLFAKDLILENPILIWILVFILVFTLGGITGLVLSRIVVDTYVHDTYFVVAHFHLVLSIRASFGRLLRIYLWSPDLYKIKLSAKVTLQSIFFIVLGTILIFSPIHLLGLYGVPRRIILLPNWTKIWGIVIASGVIFSWVGIYLSLWSVILRFLTIRVVINNTKKTSEIVLEFIAKIRSSPKIYYALLVYLELLSEE